MFLYLTFVALNTNNYIYMYMLVPMYQVTICVPFVRKYLNATDVHVGYLYMIRY
jgi:hypothetical protein